MEPRARALRATRTVMRRTFITAAAGQTGDQCALLNNGSGSGDALLLYFVDNLSNFVFTLSVL